MLPKPVDKPFKREIHDCLFIAYYNYVLEVWNRISQKYSTGRGGDSWYLARGSGSALHSRVKCSRQACNWAPWITVSAPRCSRVANAITWRTPVVQNRTTRQTSWTARCEKWHSFAHTVTGLRSNTLDNQCGATITNISASGASLPLRKYAEEGKQLEID